MALKLGTTTASLYLGSTPVAAYLGAEQVHSAGATLYFDGAVDGDWAEIGNWWLDAAYTVPATSLPAASDNVFVNATLGLNSGDPVTVANLTVVGVTFSMDITVTGMATFSGGGLVGSVTLTGNAVFNDNADNAATVVGNATFNDGSYLSGTVNGNATFNDGSSMLDILGTPTVTGNATFTLSAVPDTSPFPADFTVSGTLSFPNYPHNPYGCTSSGADNYASTALVDDGSCEYSE
jgi:hypothetical protein